MFSFESPQKDLQTLGLFGIAKKEYNNRRTLGFLFVAQVMKPLTCSMTTEPPGVLSPSKWLCTT